MDAVFACPQRPLFQVREATVLAGPTRLSPAMLGCGFVRDVLAEHQRVVTSPLPIIVFRSPDRRVLGYPRAEHCLSAVAVKPVGSGNAASSAIGDSLAARRPHQRFLKRVPIGQALESARGINGVPLLNLHQGRTPGP